MNQRTSWIVVVLAAGAVWAITAGINHAQTPGAAPGPSRVAVVNLVRVFNEFEQTKVLNQKMQEHLDKLTAEAAKKAEAINVERDTLDAVAPNTAKWFTQSEKIQKMTIEARVWEEVAKGRIAQNHRRWVMLTYEALMTEIAAAEAAVEGVNFSFACVVGG